MAHARGSRTIGKGRVTLLGVAVAIVLVAAAVWGVVLFQAAPDGGSLEARVTAVGNTVRCPICKDPIPLNDVYNVQALQMRQFIRTALQRGVSEDGVRQLLVQQYGPDILLAPPQRGFDLLVWLVPLGAVAACAVAVLLVIRRWSGGAPDVPAAETPPSSPESRRYEQMLDRELAARE